MRRRADMHGILPGPPAQRFMKPPLSRYIALAQRRTMALMSRRGPLLEKVLERVVGDAGIEIGRNRHCAGRAEQQRVAVRRGLRHRAGTDGAARAGAVVDDYNLSQVLRQFLPDYARQHVIDTAGWKRHDKADGLVRIDLTQDRLAQAA